ncbi:hypothetical protein HRJ46_23670, partial [Vibrio coralliilyticus]|nr:hypothetical protein [Vibrio coralliilyticus]
MYAIEPLLNIEFIEFPKDQDRSQIVVDGLNLCDKTYSFRKKWLYIKESEVYDQLCDYSVHSLMRTFDKIDYDSPPDGHFDDYINIELTNRAPDQWSEDVSYVEDRAWILASHWFDIEDWSRPWSVRKYFETFCLVLDKSYPFACSSCSISDHDYHGNILYDLYNGIGLAIEVPNDNTNLSSITFEVKKLLTDVANETINLLRNELENEDVIERSIVFPPEYHQAGLGILNYFGTYINEKYPEQNARVKIEQHGLTVRMIVETESGSREVLE